MRKYKSISVFYTNDVNTSAELFRKLRPVELNGPEEAFFERYENDVKYVKLYFAEILQQKMIISVIKLRDNFLVTLTNKIIKVKVTFF